MESFRETAMPVIRVNATVIPTELEAVRGALAVFNLLMLYSWNMCNKSYYLFSPVIKNIKK